MSSFEKFCNLVQDACSLIGNIEDVRKIIEGTPFEIDDVAMSLDYNESRTPLLAFAYCDFGTAPEGQEIRFYETLLRENLILNIGLAPSFAMSSETNNILCVIPFPLENMPAESLYKMLLAFAAFAKNWRNSFIKNIAAPPPPPDTLTTLPQHWVR